MRQFLSSAALVCLLAPPTQAQERPLPDPQTFLQEVRKRLDTDDERQSGYVYVQTRHDQKLDKEGRPVGGSVKVFESYPGLPGERRWERLIAKDGQLIPPHELDKADRERQKHAEEYARKLARDGPKDPVKEARERERRARRRAERIDEVFRVFDVQMLGRETLDGHDVLVFSLTPRPDAKPRTRAGKIMRSFAARAWVSESDYELARLEVESIDTFSIAFGVLARVHKGSRASFRRRKIDGEWLPARASWSFSARVGLVTVMRRAITAEFSNYRKYNVGTTATYGQPRPGSR